MLLTSEMRSARVLVLWLAAMVLPLQAAAQPRALDVPYVPTPMHIVEAMLRLAKPTSSDILFDLGCGDGRIPIAAAKQFGTRGIGVDLNAVRIIEARANAEVAGVTDKVEFIEGDLFRTDFSKATVLTLYLLPMVNMRLRPTILLMKPGTRVVSHAFDFEDWEPDAVEQHTFQKVFYWVVPAKVTGWWTGRVDGHEIEIEFRQRYQKLSGVARIGEARTPIAGGTIRGETVTFEIALPGGRQRVVYGGLQGGVLTGEGWHLKRI